MNSKIWTFVGLIISLGIIAFAWLLVGQPQLDSINKIDTQILSSQSNKELQTIQLTKLQNMTDEEISTLTSQSHSMELLIPDSLKDSEVFAEIENIQNSSGATINSISITHDPTESNDSTVSVYPVTLSGDGDKESVINCISDLQNMERLLVIDSLTLSPSDTNYNFSITGSIYVMNNS